MILLALTAFPSLAQAQIQPFDKWNFGFYADVAKSRQEGFLEHLQTAAEVNYHPFRKVSITSGFEYWSAYIGLGIVGGARYYPHKNVFVRIRRIFFINSNAIGAGYKKSIGKSWNGEVMIDYYSEETIAARIGVSYTLKD